MYPVGRALKHQTVPTAVFNPLVLPLHKEGHEPEQRNEPPVDFRGIPKVYLIKKTYQTL